MPPRPTGSSTLRGEIWLADLDSARGSEANKQRPATIVSNNRANSVAHRLGPGVVRVVPVISNTDHVYPIHTLLPAEATGLQRDAKAQAEPIRSIAVERLSSAIARVPPDLMAQLDDAVRLHLQL